MTVRQIVASLCMSLCMCVCAWVCVCKWRRKTPLTNEVNSMRALAKNEAKFVGGGVWLN